MMKHKNPTPPPPTTHRPGRLPPTLHLPIKTSWPHFMLLPPPWPTPLLHPPPTPLMEEQRRRPAALWRLQTAMFSWRQQIYRAPLPQLLGHRPCFCQELEGEAGGRRVMSLSRTSTSNCLPGGNSPGTRRGARAGVTWPQSLNLGGEARLLDSSSPPCR